MCRTKLFNGDRELYNIHRKWQRSIDNARRQEKQLRGKHKKSVRVFPSFWYQAARDYMQEFKEAVKKAGKEICSCGRIADTPLCRKCFDKGLKRGTAL